MYRSAPMLIYLYYGNRNGNILPIAALVGRNLTDGYRKSQRKLGAPRPFLDVLINTTNI